MKEKLGDILLAVDLGFDLKQVAEGYVQAFNKSGAHMILNYEIREPLEAELEQARQHSKTVKKEKSYWVAEKEMFDGSVVKKRLFVLVPTKTQKTPDHIMKLRPPVKQTKIEVGGNGGD